MKKIYILICLMAIFLLHSNIQAANAPNVQDKKQNNNSATTKTNKAEIDKQKELSDAKILGKAQQAIEQKKFTVAFNLLQPLAKSNHAEAMYFIGRMYEAGEGVKRDLKAATSWYAKAAKGGDVSAQNSYGGALASGQGVKKNAKEAVNWFRKAAD